MNYPPDGTPFEIDSATVSILYRAARGMPLTNDERRQAEVAVDYICAATLVVQPEENEEEDKRVVLRFPGFPPIRGTGPAIKAIEAYGTHECGDCGATAVYTDADQAGSYCASCAARG